ncbi:MAG: hypothetical protein ACOC5K_05220 [Chloroflexota bacterium]
MNSSSNAAFRAIAYSAATLGALYLITTFMILGLAVAGYEPGPYWENGDDFGQYWGGALVYVLPILAGAAASGALTYIAGQRKRAPIAGSGLLVLSLLLGATVFYLLPRAAAHVVTLLLTIVLAVLCGWYVATTVRSENEPGS